MYILLLSITLILLAVLVTISALSEKKYRNVVLTEKMRCRDYYQTIVMLWGMALIVIVTCLIININLGDIGLRLISFNYNIWFTVVILALSGLVIIFFIVQTIQLLTNEKAREETKKKIATGEGAGQILPRTKKEKRIFVLLSLTAGVCEEIVFRGFLVFLLQSVFPGIPIYLIVLIASVIFGLCHFYQGWTGILKTGATGAFFLCLILATNSLILAMILHFLVDASSVFLLDEEGSEKQQETDTENEMLN